MLLRSHLPIALLFSASSFACGTNPAEPPGARLDAGAVTDVPMDASGDTSPVVPADVPVAVDLPATPDAGPLMFRRVAASSTGHACAVRSDGTLWCWGLNDRGQLARAPADSSAQCRVRGSSPPRSLPCEQRARRTTAFDDVTDVAVGNGSTCALRRDGSVWCWGLNDSGQLGGGSANNAANPTPTRVEVPAARSIASGAFHTCAALMDGAVRCWGSNKFAQVGVAVAMSASRCDEGDGTLTACAPTPVAVTGITNARAVSLGRWHSCALTAEGTVRCWGLNDSAQLGNGAVDPDSTPRPAPVTPSVDRVTALAAGGSHTCALRDDGTLRCWGWADIGQLAGAATEACTGASGPFRCARAPVALAAPVGVAAVAAGRYHTCTAGADGVVRCFGRNDNGQVGVEPSNAETCAVIPDRFPCVRAPAEAGVAASTALSLGDYHACSITRGGEVRCWGWNQWGQLGDGSTDDRASSVLVQRAE